MGGEHRRELPFALPARAIEAIGPGGVPSGVDQLGLERVDPPHEAREQRQRPPAEVVVGKLQLIGALEQHRQPLRRAQHVDERVDPGMARLDRQERPAQLREGMDREVLVRALECDLDPLAQILLGADHKDPVGLEPLVGQRHHTANQHLRLAGSWATDHQQRRAAMGDRVALRVGQAIEGARHCT